MDSNSSSLITTRQNSLPRHVTFSIFAVPLAFIGLFFVFPVANLLIRALNLNEIFSTITEDAFIEAGIFSFAQAIISTIITVILGLFPAFVLSRFTFKGSRFINSFLLVPFMLPTVVAAWAFIALLPENIRNTVYAVIIVHVFFNLAVVIKIVGNTWALIPKEIEQAASTLGSNTQNTFKKVTLPLILPSILTASTIIFLFTFTSFGVIKVIGGPNNSTLEVLVSQKALLLNDIPGAAAVSVIQLLFLSITILALLAISKGRKISFNSHPQRKEKLSTQKNNFLKRAIIIVTFLATATPLLALFIASFRLGNTWSTYAWTHLGSTEIRPGLSLGVDPISSMLVSVKYAIATVLISLVIGFTAAFSIFISKRNSKIMEVSYFLPLATSAVTIGFGILITFSRFPIDWRAKWWIVPIGHSLIAIPFVIRSFLEVLRKRPPGWMQAGASLGASPLRNHIEIDALRLGGPLRVSAGIAGAISLGEFGATTFLTRTGNDSMPIAIAKLATRTGDIPRAQGFMMASVLAICTCLIIFSIEGRNA